MSVKTGLLLVGHGTRSAVGTQQFLALAERIRQRMVGQLLVEPAFLELQQPDIDAAVGRLVDHGSGRLVTMPLLLFAAGHAKEDVPRAVEAALERRGRSDVPQAQARHLGCHPAIVELSRLRMEEAQSKVQSPTSKVERSDACLLLVGRGSRDESATAEMCEFAALRGETLGVGNAAAAEPLACAAGLYVRPEKVEVAFLAMARPLLQDELPRIARFGYLRVMVQPHLLFPGELVDSIERQVVEARKQFAEIEWIIAQPLADLPGAESRAAELIEKVIWDRCQEAGIHVVGAGADD
jgi:sirohydrochlorin cobaltochelatase